MQNNKNGSQHAVLLGLHLLAVITDTDNSSVNTPVESISSRTDVKSFSNRTKLSPKRRLEANDVEYRFPMIESTVHVYE